MKKYFLIIILLPVLSFQKKERPSCTEIKLYEAADFNVGAAVNLDKLESDENYRRIIVSQFNSFTPEKIMKAAFIHPQENVFDFKETDRLIDFCRKNNKRTHGHTLVWYKRLPGWMEHYSGDTQAWEQMLKTHIQTIIGHCKGYIKSWDVVNEAFNDDGSLRENCWLKNIGPSYIEKSFIYAAEADPSAKLFYNDFDLESNPRKLNAVLKFFASLRNAGVHIDGIGMQMHISVSYPYVSDINEAALIIQNKNFLVHYSETDISISMSDKLFANTGSMLKLQKERMKEIVRGYMKLKKESRFGITMWGVSDNDSWLLKNNRRDKPLLFDAAYKVKPAYCGFVEGLMQ